VNYFTWLSKVFVLFLLMIPVTWWSLNQYFSVNWIQSSMISGIIMGSIAIYIDLTSDRLKGEVKDES